MVVLLWLSIILVSNTNRLKENLLIPLFVISVGFFVLDLVAKKLGCSLHGMIFSPRPTITALLTSQATATAIFQRTTENMLANATQMVDDIANNNDPFVQRTTEAVATLRKSIIQIMDNCHPRRGYKLLRRKLLNTHGRGLVQEEEAEIK